MTAKEDVKVELTDIDRVLPYPNNPKKHSPDQIKVLSGLIKKHGWTQPIIVDLDGEIIAGHGRRLAAIELSLKRVPVIWRKDLTKAEAAALRLADNRIVSTDFDTMMEQSELAMLNEQGYAVEDLPYSTVELEFLSAELDKLNEDAFVEDVSSAVAEQKSANEEKADEVDQSAAPVGDALGFKRVSVEQSRAIRKFMGSLEAKYGLKGVDALMSHIGDQ